MSEFKFACPVCSQHISCDTTKAGSQMECPTCFQKLTVPQAAEGESSKFIITASQVQARPTPNVVLTSEPPVRKKEFPFAAIGFVLVLAALTTIGFVFRDRIFKRTPQAGPLTAGSTQNPLPPPAPLTSTDTNWTLNLENVTLPETTATGKINGRDFTCQRSTLHGGMLNLRQGPRWPPDLGVTVYLIAPRGEDLAGRKINIPADVPNPPQVRLRWKDDQGGARTRNIRSGYACRVEFGQVASNHLAGKIYICTPDDNRSWVAGAFNAEIRVPEP